MSKDDPRPRVVFDCMIFLQATASESGPAAALLRLVERNVLSLFVSREILDEVRDVLSRTKLRKKNPDITSERVDALITRVAEKGAIVETVPEHFSYVRDPRDEKYINLAIEVEADYIVSRDQDLLDLMTGYTDECKDFRRRFRLLRIIGPVELLKSVGPKESNGEIAQQ
jgi:putative PIN family toxin of toxin-antitoxin system